MSIGENVNLFYFFINPHQDNVTKETQLEPMWCANNCSSTGAVGALCWSKKFKQRQTIMLPQSMTTFEGPRSVVPMSLKAFRPVLTARQQTTCCLEVYS